MADAAHLPNPPIFRYGRPESRQARVSTAGYLAFETDLGGFNNILMHFEIMAVLAWLTGRTLIVPPATRLYLLGTAPLSLLDLFDRDALEKHLDVLTPEEFCERRKLAPQNASHTEFHAWMREHGHAPGWNATTDAFAHSPNALTTRFELISRLFGRRPVGITESERKCEILYFPTSHEHRMFGVFEAFFLFADPADERRARALARDAIRYHPDVIALAERAIHSPPFIAQPYSSLHIRRGDFQYENTQISADSILSHTEKLFRPGQTLYVATDETNPEFLRPFRDRYTVLTFEDLGHDAVTAIPFHWAGIVETLICAAAPERFVGTRLSTFSARISTLRGHISSTPNSALSGIDTALYYTQPPLWQARPEFKRPYSEPVRKHDDEFGETALPWWESRWVTPIWGRAHQAIWAETD